MGSKFRSIRLTATEMQAISENDLECFASTGVNMLPMAKAKDDGQNPTLRCEPRGQKVSFRDLQPAVNRQKSPYELAVNRRGVEVKVKSPSPNDRFVIA